MTSRRALECVLVINESNPEITSESMTDKNIKNTVDEIASEATLAIAQDNCNEVQNQITLSPKTFQDSCIQVCTHIKYYLSFDLF